MILTIVAAPEGSNMLGVSHKLPAGGATLGRSSNNTIPLPDTSRITSSNHATITEQQGKFALVDHSSNGTFLNGADVPLEKGSSTPLNIGDVVSIGPYQISIAQEQTIAEPDDLGGSFLDALSDNGKQASDNGRIEPSISNPDFDDDLDKWLAPGSAATSSNSNWDSPQAPAPAQAAPIAPTPNIAESVDPLDMLNKVTPAQQPAESPLFASTSGEDSQWWKEPQPDHAPAVNHAMTPPKPVAPQRNQPAVPEVPAPVAPNAAASAPGASEIAQRMGLRDLSAEQLAQLPPAVADALVQTLSRLMEILRARSNIKNEIRAMHTVIGAVENNPLKFAAQIDDAVNYMFSSKSAAFMNANRAIDDSFNDLEDHQMATLAGTRAAYEAMLAYFNPAQIIQETGADPTEGRLSGGKKAKAWDAFQKHYDKLMADSEGTYNRLFGEEFAHNYEQQVHQLKAMRQKRN